MKQRTMMCILLLGYMLFGIAREAAADSCTAVNNTFTMPSTLIIPRDLPVGSQIGPAITTGTYTVFSNCSKTTSGNMNVGIGTNATFVQSISGARLYATGIPGVSFSLAATQPGGCSGTTPVIGSSPFQGNANMRLLCANSGYWPNVTFQYTLRFYKTGTTTGSGRVGSLTAGFGFVYFDGSGFISPNSNLTVTGISAQTTTCSVTNSNVNVKLDQAKIQDFSGSGSTTGNKAFNISLSNCDAGINVSMYLSAGGAGSSNESLGLLNADSGSTASGLGLQLLYNNSPVKLGSTNMFKVVSTPTTSGAGYTIPMAVRYYQTATPLKAGTVNSSATFTMVYN